MGVQLTPALKVAVLSELNYRIANPSGTWADYNIIYRAWRIVRDSMVQGDLFEYADLPPKPNALDYPDITSPSTIGNLTLIDWKNLTQEQWEALQIGDWSNMTLMNVVAGWPDIYGNPYVFYGTIDLN